MINNTACSSLNTLYSCYYYLGSKTWPEYPSAGMLINLFLLIILILFLIKYLNRTLLH